MVDQGVEGKTQVGGGEDDKVHVTEQEGDFGGDRAEAEAGSLVSGTAGNR